MRSERTIVATSIVLGLLSWVADAVVDHALFSEKPFWDLLIADLPASEIYMRLLVCVLFVAFGLLASRLVARHRLAEAALRESEATHRAFLEAIPDMIFRVSRDGIFVDYKPGKDLRPFVPASEFLGKKVLEILPAEVAPAIMEKVQRVLETGQMQTIEFDLPEEDGARGYQARLVAAGKDEVIAIVDDITERKQMEAALRAAESNYRSIFENAMEGIFRTSEDGRIQMCNPALARMHGYESPEEMMESVKDTTLQIWVDPEKRTEYKRRLADSGFALGFEGQGRRKDGSVIWGLVNARAVRDSSGKLLYYEGSVQDITERKRAEKELRTLSTYLLRSQDQERRRIGRELHDSTAQKLAALGMNLSLINGSAASVDSKAHKHLLESQALVQECLREIRTLSHLLHPPLLDEVGLASALRWYADGFAQRSGIRVDLQLPPSLTRMSQEVETTLFRVVQECLTNVHLHSRSPTARICILRSPDSVVAAVTDQGCGMRSADRNGTTGTVEIGVGIAGMRERVEQFGGRLEIDSTHAGTTVKATLPLPEDGP
jgi:PAS domain S-box-containing protein